MSPFLPSRPEHGLQTETGSAACPNVSFEEDEAAVWTA